MTVTGLLDGLNPNAPRRAPRQRDPDAEKLVELAIEQSAQCRAVEQLRAELASHFIGVLDEDIRWASDRILSPAKLRDYKAIFKRFASWCAEQPTPLPSLPSVPEACASYLLERAGEGARPAVLDKTLAAIRW